MLGTLSEASQLREHQYNEVCRAQDGENSGRLVLVSIASTILMENCRSGLSNARLPRQKKALEENMFMDLSIVFLKEQSLGATRTGNQRTSKRTTKTKHKLADAHCQG